MALEKKSVPKVVQGIGWDELDVFLQIDATHESIANVGEKFVLRYMKYLKAKRGKSFENFQKYILLSGDGNFKTES